MSASNEECWQRGQRVLEDLAELGVVPSPECYQVWFAHISGDNDALSHAVEERAAGDRPIDSQFLFSLYDKIFGPTGLAPDIIELCEELNIRLGGVQEAAQGLQKNAMCFNSEVEELADDASDEDMSPAALRMVARMVSAAKEAAARNEELEGRLSEANAQIGIMSETISEIETKANTDALTKVANRRQFDAFIEKARKKALEQDSPLSLILCDVDHFKKFNDTWGHPAGDQVLRFVAATLKKNTKGKDLVARYGGEEFAIVLPETRLEDAQSLADTIREAIARTKLKKKSSDESMGTVTASFGVAHLASDISVETLIREADAALYEAKHSGRNRVVVAVEETKFRAAG